MKSVAIILALLTATAFPAAAGQPPPPPISYNNRFKPMPPSLPAPPPAAQLPAPSGAWQSAPSGLPSSVQPSNPLLLTDGTVIIHNGNQSDWWRLTPDVNGSYVNGTWSQFASLPSGYGPLYFASAVLADGRVIVEGGEYNMYGSPTWTNKGAIWSPSTGTWVPVSPPWGNIGDASSAVLDDGTFILANSISSQTALLNSANLTWTATGSGKATSNNEEGWTLLPNGDLLTTHTCDSGSERYVNATGVWVFAGTVPVILSDCNEMGPGILRPDGYVFAFGGRNQGPNPIAAFNTATNAWSAGPNVPANYTLTDAPAAMLPNGNIIFAASPSLYGAPTHFWEFDGQTFTQVADTPNAPYISSYYANFLVLPSGQILATDFFSTMIYTPSGSALPAWAPVISTYPSSVLQGSTYALTGTQFNGLSQGAMYGDDAQGATNYPLVMLKNLTSGHVFYARTSGHSTMSVAPDAPGGTNFTVTAATESGLADLYVIANGIASSPVQVNVGSTNNNNSNNQFNNICVGNGCNSFVNNNGTNNNNTNTNPTCLFFLLNQCFYFY
jgi:hypothetical protein